MNGSISFNWENVHIAVKTGESFYDGSKYVRVSFNHGDLGLHLSPEQAKQLRDALTVALADLAEQPA